MTVVLTIENEQSLPNGAPVSVRLTGKRGIDIGRSATSDWPLPDPSRFISGRHCEVRYRDNGYWLNDLSTNGTFLNDSARRIQTPHRLRHGDRLAIGSYVIAVAIEAEDAGGAAFVASEETETTASEAASVADAPLAPLAPLEKSDAARLDAEIAQAIASESAPLPVAQADGEDSGLLDGARAVRSTPVAATRPQTMVRARGFGVTAPREPANEAPDPAQSWSAAAGSPASIAATEDVEGIGGDALDAKAEEARAWSAPAGPAGADSRAMPADAAERQSVEPPERRAASPQAAPAMAPGAEEFLRRFAKGAGVPEHIFARQDGLKVAEDLGALMRMTVEDLTQLLSARFKAKRFARASSQTMIQALDNNPLKFAPTATDALKIMFGPRTSGYLDAKRALEGAFTDLKSHQVMTFAAMQQAVRMLVEDFDPQTIEKSAGDDQGLAALFGGRKARLWDLFVARWQAKTLRHEDGLVDAFMLYFAQCYDQNKESK